MPLLSLPLDPTSLTSLTVMRMLGNFRATSDGTFFAQGPRSRLNILEQLVNLPLRWNLRGEWLFAQTRAPLSLCLVGVL